MNKLEYIAGEPEIPKSLEESFEKLKFLFGDNLEKFKAVEEKDICQYHHSAGSWIRNNWKLWGETSTHLKDWFTELKIWHPDDMSSIILDSFHRYLHNKPLELEKQAQYYIDYWKKNKHEQEAL